MVLLAKARWVLLLGTLAFVPAKAKLAPLQGMLASLLRALASLPAKAKLAPLQGMLASLLRALASLPAKAKLASLLGAPVFLPAKAKLASLLGAPASLLAKAKLAPLLGAMALPPGARVLLLGVLALLREALALPLEFQLVKAKKVLVAKRLGLSMQHFRRQNNGVPH